MVMVLGGSGTISGLVANGLPSGVVTSSTLSSDAIYLTSPAGAVCFVAQNTAPAGWIKANGAAISRTTYSALFAAIGTTFGGGNGSTTFNVPDLRGEFLRGWDDSRGIDSGRSFGSYQDPSMTLAQVGYAHDVSFNNMETGYGSQSFSFYQISNSTTNTYNWQAFRPRNYALLACIKY